jgi:hypothetical protein
MIPLFTTDASGNYMGWFSFVNTGKPDLLLETPSSVYSNLAILEQLYLEEL